MGINKWKRKTDNPFFDGSAVFEFNSTTLYSPDDMISSEIDEYFGLPSWNGIFFEDLTSLFNIISK